MNSLCTHLVHRIKYDSVYTVLLWIMLKARNHKLYTCLNDWMKLRSAFVCGWHWKMRGLLVWLYLQFQGIESSVDDVMDNRGEIGNCDFFLTVLSKELIARLSTGHYSSIERRDISFVRKWLKRELSINSFTVRVTVFDNRKTMHASCFCRLICSFICILYDFR